MTDVGHHHGTMAAMAGTVRGTIRGMLLGMIPGMIHGIMVATAIMVGRLPGAMAGTVPIIVRGATMAGTDLFITMVVEDIEASIPSLQVSTTIIVVTTQIMVLAV